MSHTDVENWRPVVGSEDQYEVSDLGRVRSTPRLTASGAPDKRLGGVLKPTTLKSGHQQVSLGRRGSARYVHRLVLEAFVGPCPEGYVTCHYDDNPANNALSNLRWGARSENSRDAVRNGRWHTANRTECPQGHPYDEENTYRYTAPDGSVRRFCRTCDRARPRRGRSSYDENGVWGRH